MITLKKIRAHSPCRDGWHALMHYLGKTKADDEPLSLKTILDANGLDDALWCLSTIKGHDREIRLYAVWCARQMQYLMIDPRSISALNVAERYARGKASAEELSAASAGAWEAAREAAARVTAREAEAGATARATARAARAAWDADKAAASATASTALEAAREAAAQARWAAWAANTAEWTVKAVKSAQEDEFRRMCREIEAGRDPYQEEEDGR